MPIGRLITGGLNTLFRPIFGFIGTLEPKMQVPVMTTGFVLVSGSIYEFLIMPKNKPRTMTPEWRAATEEIRKKNQADPISNRGKAGYDI